MATQTVNLSSQVLVLRRRSLPLLRQKSLPNPEVAAAAPPKLVGQPPLGKEGGTLRRQPLKDRNNVQIGGLEKHCLERIASAGAPEGKLLRRQAVNSRRSSLGDGDVRRTPKHSGVEAVGMAVESPLNGPPACGEKGLERDGRSFLTMEGGVGWSPGCLASEGMGSADNCTFEKEDCDAAETLPGLEKEAPGSPPVETLQGTVVLSGYEEEAETSEDPPSAARVQCDDIVEQVLELQGGGTEPELDPPPLLQGNELDPPPIFQGNEPLASCRYFSTPVAAELSKKRYLSPVLEESCSLDHRGRSPHMVPSPSNHPLQAASIKKEKEEVSEKNPALFCSFFAEECVAVVNQILSNPSTPGTPWKGAQPARDGSNVDVSTIEAEPLPCDWTPMKSFIEQSCVNPETSDMWGVSLLDLENLNLQLVELKETREEGGEGGREEDDESKAAGSSLRDLVSAESCALALLERVRALRSRSLSSQGKTCKEPPEKKECGNATVLLETVEEAEEPSGSGSYRASDAAQESLEKKEEGTSPGVGGNATIDLPNTVVDLNATIDLPNTMMDLKNATMELPNATMDLKNAAGMEVEPAKGEADHNQTWELKPGAAGGVPEGERGAADQVAGRGPPSESTFNRSVLTSPVVSQQGQDCFLPWPADGSPDIKSSCLVTSTPLAGPKFQQGKAMKCLSFNRDSSALFSISRGEGSSTQVSASSSSSSSKPLQSNSQASTLPTRASQSIRPPNILGQQKTLLPPSATGLPTLPRKSLVPPSLRYTRPKTLVPPGAVQSQRPSLGNPHFGLPSGPARPSPGVKMQRPPRPASVKKPERGGGKSSSTAETSAFTPGCNSTKPASSGLKPPAAAGAKALGSSLPKPGVSGTRPSHMSLQGPKVSADLKAREVRKPGSASPRGLATNSSAVPGPSGITQKPSGPAAASGERRQSGKFRDTEESSLPTAKRQKIVPGSSIPSVCRIPLKPTASASAPRGLLRPSVRQSGKYQRLQQSSLVTPKRQIRGPTPPPGSAKPRATPLKQTVGPFTSANFTFEPKQRSVSPPRQTEVTVPSANLTFEPEQPDSSPAKQTPGPAPSTKLACEPEKPAVSPPEQTEGPASQVDLASEPEQPAASPLKQAEGAATPSSLPGAEEPAPPLDPTQEPEYPIARSPEQAEGSVPSSANVTFEPEQPAVSPLKQTEVQSNCPKPEPCQPAAGPLKENQECEQCAWYQHENRTLTETIRALRERLAKETHDC
ncbi:proteoglycan 4-like isoform X2 [Acipenser oxyrinchus oxyrinchus]|uniref:Proteoglycan 4-like isoform X2 n=1 Tax=Acipenser oxyrinchus oxyrinchus TaxID=40147 RepID=A0AAD8D682_ACIOX|nr:proteoglycan 4-like isoform X2 [Acipenser oxyrinchus oxyrinchus]